MLATFFTISGDDVSTILGYIADFIGNISPLMWIVIAIGVGLIIFTAIVSAIRGHR